MRSRPWVRWSLSPALQPRAGEPPRLTLSVRLGASDPRAPSDLAGRSSLGAPPVGAGLAPTASTDPFPVRERIGSGSPDAARFHVRVARARPTLGDPGLVAEAAGVLPGRIEALTPQGVVDGLTVGAPLFDNLGTLLKAAVAAGAPAPGAVGHLVVACDAMVVRDLPGQLDAMLALVALGWCVDLWATHPAADLGALAQLALIGRGELVFGPASGTRHGHRLRALAGLAAAPVHIEVQPAPRARVTAIFRAAPTVLYYGQPEDPREGARVVVSSSPAVLGAHHHWLFDLGVPPGGPGLLAGSPTATWLGSDAAADAAVEGRPNAGPPSAEAPDAEPPSAETPDAEPSSAEPSSAEPSTAEQTALPAPEDSAPLPWAPNWVAQVRVVGADGVVLPWQPAALGAHPDPGGAWVIDSGVARARERAEVAVEFEHIAAAFARGDGRRVAHGISALVRFALSLGDEVTAERAYALRLGFLRTGTVDRGELNRLRVALWAGVAA